jgi:hydrogenase maturation factor
MSGPKIAALYGLIPNKLGLCGPQQDLLKKFIAGKISIPEIIPILKKFEAAYAYYQLIAQKNKITSPFNKKVVEAYWLGNKLLDKFTASDLRKLINERFCRPGLLFKKEAARRASLVPENSKPHHSFHVLVLGSITDSVDFTGKTKLKDICRIAWGRVVKKSKIKNQKSKITVSYNPLIGKNKIKFGPPIRKDINWDKEILPKVKIGDWVSFHWNFAIQKLNEENIINLYKYTQNTLNSLYGKK